MMGTKILIANRGEIALRIVRACRELGLVSVVAYSEADRDSLPVMLADEAICIGPAQASESYLKLDRIFAAAELTGASAIHPGYGFLAENAHLAKICEDCGIKFVGPSWTALAAMGCKTTARELMTKAGVPVTPGSQGKLRNCEEALVYARELGYPVILKASAGGGGRGMRRVNEASEMANAYDSASREAKNAFSSDELFMEKFIENPKHVEIQLMADGEGNVVQLGERDCSMQRRNQKVIEESPCAKLDDATRRRMEKAAVTAAKAVNYTGAGTVEFLLGGDKSFYFMEMNTRIQVEHPVTEAVTGRDLVKDQILVALGEKLPYRQLDIKRSGHAIEVRINAEAPERNFAPCPGKITFYAQPGGPGVRVDSHVCAGTVISPYYDNLLGKLIVSAPTRTEAISRAQRALREYIIQGVATNIDYAQELLALPDFQDASYNTSTIERMLAQKAPANK